MKQSSSVFTLHKANDRCRAPQAFGLAVDRSCSTFSSCITHLRCTDLYFRQNPTFQYRIAAACLDQSCCIVQAIISRSNVGIAE